MVDPRLQKPCLILPPGTQVVTLVELKGSSGEVRQPRGAVGRIVKAPVDATHSYRVRFPDGSEASLVRGELSVRKEFHRDGLEGSHDALDEHRLQAHVIYRCVIGSPTSNFGIQRATWP